MEGIEINLLDNIFWHCLSGPHAHFSAGTDDARRYARGFSPIVAFPEPEHPNFAALAEFCEPGEQFYCDGWSGDAPPGWRIEAESTMFRMVWNGVSVPAAGMGFPPARERRIFGLEPVIPAQAGIPFAATETDAAPDAIPLGPEHAAQAVELAALTRPGPFGPRTIELGEYFGYFDGDRLIAMAGERTAAAGLREISGVCTHPDYQGRGLARKLMAKLVWRQLQRGETPFLHVMRTNVTAHELYLRMGFVDYCESVVRVVAPI